MSLQCISLIAVEIQKHSIISKCFCISGAASHHLLSANGIQQYEISGLNMNQEATASGVKKQKVGGSSGDEYLTQHWTKLK